MARQRSASASVSGVAGSPVMKQVEKQTDTFLMVPPAHTTLRLADRLEMKLSVGPSWKSNHRFCRSSSSRTSELQENEMFGSSSGGCGRLSRSTTMVF